MNYTAPRSGSIRKAHSPGGLPVRAEEATRGSHRRPVFRQPAGARTCSESRLSAQIIHFGRHSTRPKIRNHFSQRLYYCPISNSSPITV